ncbi:hypothetical protein [Actinomadura luteofluorescens]|uniref:hypothetical protein n=1 Tax=Actinomadura luteofluorescens TaxID=46163 RepID=UPI0030CF916D
MGSHGRPKKKISKDFPQVAALSQCLRDLMDARGLTKDKLLAAAGIRGHSRLDRYLNGDAVPEERLLEAFFIAPLETVRKLDDDEVRTLQQCYRAALDEREPRPATFADQVPILEKDLATAKKDLAAAEETLGLMWGVVTLLAAHGEKHRQAAEELREALGHLEVGLAAAKQQLREAEKAERHSNAQAEMLKFQGSWFSQKLTQRALQVDSLHEHARVMETSLVKALTRISRQKETIQELKDMQLLQEQHSAHYRDTIAVLEKVREDDEDKYRQAMEEWDQTVQDWDREKAALTGQVEGLQREVERLKADNSQVSPVSLRRGNMAGAVEWGRPGWYLNSTLPDVEAYWDGQRWTGEKRPAHPAARDMWRPKGRHARPEPTQDERNAVAAWNGYCAGYQIVEQAPAGWALSLVRGDIRYDLETLLLPLGASIAVPAFSDPARKAYEAGFWRAIENRCLTEGEAQKAFRKSKRNTGGGRHVSPTNSTVPDLPLIPGPLTERPITEPWSSAWRAIEGDGSWNVTNTPTHLDGAPHDFWATTASRFRLRR